MRALKSDDRCSAGGDVADLCLNFVATGSDGDEIPLLPGGQGKDAPGSFKVLACCSRSYLKLP